MRFNALEENFYDLAPDAASHSKRRNFFIITFLSVLSLEVYFQDADAVINAVPHHLAILIEQHFSNSLD